MKYRAASGSPVLWFSGANAARSANATKIANAITVANATTGTNGATLNQGDSFSFCGCIRALPCLKNAPMPISPKGWQGQQWLYYDTFKAPESDAGTAVTLADYRGNTYTPTREKTKLHKIHISCNNVDFVRTDKRLFIGIISNVHDCT